MEDIKDSDNNQAKSLYKEQRFNTQGTKILK